MRCVLLRCAPLRCRARREHGLVAEGPLKGSMRGLRAPATCLASRPPPLASTTPVPQPSLSSGRPRQERLAENDFSAELFLLTQPLTQQAATLARSTPMHAGNRRKRTQPCDATGSAHRPVFNPPAGISSSTTRFSGLYWASISVDTVRQRHPGMGRNNSGQLTNPIAAAAASQQATRTYPLRTPVHKVGLGANIARYATLCNFAVRRAGNATLVRVQQKESPR